MISNIIESILILLILLFSIVVHELAHGYMAYYLGDPTAKYSDRLSLNPLKHLDLLGSIILPLTMLLSSFYTGPIIGWAKPVPINPYNFKDQKWGILKVSLAGPLANFLLAIICSLFNLIIIKIFHNSFLSFGINLIIFYNLNWGIFNLIPLSPLDGFNILSTFLGEKTPKFLVQYELYILMFLLFFTNFDYYLLLITNFLFRILT